MSEERRKFLKITAGAGVAGLATMLKAKCGIAAENEQSSSNGVVVGKSPKKEILYKKNENWDRYYKSSY
ncbi:MAG: Tat pathway signal protein [Deltaproteobacteria bacterium]|nr:MAG: Tat pathway signal protein [Deltaproteobacteria bacterium]